MMRVIATEEENIRTMNYSPGPLPTDMLEVAVLKTKDQEYLKGMKGIIM